MNHRGAEGSEKARRKQGARCELAGVCKCVRKM